MDQKKPSLWWATCRDFFEVFSDPTSNEWKTQKGTEHKWQNKYISLACKRENKIDKMRFEYSANKNCLSSNFSYNSPATPTWKLGRFIFWNGSTECEDKAGPPWQTDLYLWNERLCGCCAQPGMCCMDWAQPAASSGKWGSSTGTQPASTQVIPLRVQHLLQQAKNHSGAHLMLQESNIQHGNKRKQVMQVGLRRWLPDTKVPYAYKCWPSWLDNIIRWNSNAVWKIQVFIPVEL